MKKLKSSSSRLIRLFKQNGINQESMTEFELNEFSLFSNQTLVFQQNIIEYITTEIDKIPELSNIKYYLS
jgi:hypothetical protein